MSRLIRPVLDLTRNAWKKRHGDLDVYGTWFWDEDDRTWVPCLAILCAYRALTFERTRPCVIPVDHAWAWSAEKGSWDYIAPTAVQMCSALGMEASTASIVRLVGIVRDHLEDLVKRVPPRPLDDQETTITADAIAKIDGCSRHTEITDRV